VVVVALAEVVALAGGVGPAVTVNGTVFDVPLPSVPVISCEPLVIFAGTVTVAVNAPLESVLAI
jgi:hypothetical protein